MDNKVEKKNNLWIVVAVIVVLVIVAVIIAVIVRGLSRSSGENVDMVTEAELLTDGEMTETSEILEKNVDLIVEGFDESRNTINPHGAVGVSVKNISNKQISVMFIMAAYLDNNEIVDEHFIYAERLEPGATQTFDAFINTPLTPDELKRATFKVYKAEYFTPEDELVDTGAPEETGENVENGEAKNNGSSEVEPSEETSLSL